MTRSTLSFSVLLGLLLWGAALALLAWLVGR